MITRGSITLYHKNKGKEPSYDKYIVKNAWYFNYNGSNFNKGISSTDDIQIRIPYGIISIKNIDIGDLVIIGEGKDIKLTKELNKYYTISSINNNNFGSNPHIHIGAK